MSRKLVGMLLLLLPACIVESPIADRILTAEEELVEELETWCYDTCQRVSTQCKGSDCDCSSPPSSAGSSNPAPVEDCECSPPKSALDCAVSCRDSMLGFTGQGEACANAGLDSMACFDGASSCEELEDAAEDCFLEPKEVPICHANGPVRCDLQGGGTTGTAGSAAFGTGGSTSIPPAGTNTAGTAGTGTGGTGPVPLPTACDYLFDSCSDGAEYVVTCTGSDQIYCSCYRNGDFSGAFVLPDNDCTLPSYAINPSCGWNISNIEE